MLLPCIAFAQVSVQGYTRKDGTYVQPHYRSSPNNTVRDNYSYKDNVNPYTGRVGTNTYGNNPTSDYYEAPPQINNNNNNNNLFGNSPSYNNLFGN